MVFIRWYYLQMSCSFVSSGLEDSCQPEERVLKVSFGNDRLCVKKQGNGIILTFPPKDDEKMVASDHYFDRSSISPLKSLWLKSKSCCNVHYWLRIMSCDDGRAFSFSGFPEEIKCLYYSLSASRPWQIRDGLHRTCMSNIRKHWRKFVKYSGSLSPLTDDPWHKQELREPTCPLRRCACFGKKEDEPANYRSLWVRFMWTIRSQRSLR